MNYPLQYFRLAIGNTDNNIISSDSSLSPSYITGKLVEKWYLNFIRADVFLIINALNNLVMSGKEGKVSLESLESFTDPDEEQLWTFEGVENDYDGYALYYRILNNGDSSKALTYDIDLGFILKEYTGKIYQKFKINLDGLEGFAANCKTKSGEKAGTIGGLFGPVIEVTTAEELINELKSDGPKTIVLNGNIDMKTHMHTRIRDYKTLVGSFQNHTLYDPYFRTNNEYGTEGDEPSDNIIIRNIEFEARSEIGRIMLIYGHLVKYG